MIKTKYLLLAVPIFVLSILTLVLPGRGAEPYRAYLPAVGGGSFQASDFRVTEARIVGSEGDRQTIYRPGEPVYLYVTFTSSADRDGRARWGVDSPAGRVLDDLIPSTFSAGRWEIYNEFVIPLDAGAGVYTFTYQAEPGGICPVCSIYVPFEVIP